MRGAAMLAVSVALHGALALGASRFRPRAERREVIEMTLVPAALPEPEPVHAAASAPAPAPPAARVAAPAPVPVDAGRATARRISGAASAPRLPAPAPAPRALASSGAPAPVRTDISLGNEGNSAVPRGAPPSPPPPAPPEPPTHKTLVPRPAAPPGGDGCQEPIGKPEPLERVTAIGYTPEARAAGVEGRLVLAVTVGVDGCVSDVLVQSGLDPALDAAAVAAVKTWRFRPAERCGKPVAGGVYRLASRFELGD